MTKEQEEQGFRVMDKRGFNEEGEPVSTEPQATEKEETPAGGQPSAEAEKSSAEAEKSSVKEETPPEKESPPRPPIDFPSYILSYYTQGCVLLGEVPNPYTNKKEEDLEAAKHTVDILSMLEQKTKGNLSKEEQQLLESVLYELRMKYMAKTNRIKL
jgi:hypothetical protein